MKIADLMTLLDHHVPFSTAESWDNVGLLIGDEDVEVTGVLNFQFGYYFVKSTLDVDLTYLAHLLKF